MPMMISLMDIIINVLLLVHVSLIILYSYFNLYNLIVLSMCSRTFYMGNVPYKFLYYYIIIPYSPMGLDIFHVQVMTSLVIHQAGAEAMLAYSLPVIICIPASKVLSNICYFDII